MATRKNKRKQQDYADLSRLMVFTCVRNTGVENIHAGKVPVSRTGDYSDVTVVDADERRIPWPEVSHVDDDAMRDLMREIVNRVYTFQMMGADKDFQDSIECWMPMALDWDVPKLDKDLMMAIEARRAARNDKRNAKKTGA